MVYQTTIQMKVLRLAAIFSFLYILSYPSALQATASSTSMDVDAIVQVPEELSSSICPSTDLLLTQKDSQYVVQNALIGTSEEFERILVYLGKNFILYFSGNSLDELIDNVTSRENTASTLADIIQRLATIKLFFNTYEKFDDAEDRDAAEKAKSEALRLASAVENTIFELHKKETLKDNSRNFSMLNELIVKITKLFAYFQVENVESTRRVSARKPESAIINVMKIIEETSEDTQIEFTTSLRYLLNMVRKVHTLFSSQENKTGTHSPVTYTILGLALAQGFIKLAGHCLEVHKSKWESSIEENRAPLPPTPEEVKMKQREKRGQERKRKERDERRQRRQRLRDADEEKERSATPAQVYTSSNGSKKRKRGSQTHGQNGAGQRAKQAKKRKQSVRKPPQTGTGKKKTGKRHKREARRLLVEQ